MEWFEMEECDRQSKGGVVWRVKTALAREPPFAAANVSTTVAKAALVNASNSC
jgi:hypothetical protein